MTLDRGTRWGSGPIRGRVLALCAVEILAGSGCGMMWTVVAPVFHHGSGTWFWFDKEVARPVNLTEREMLSVVEEELASAGYENIRTGFDCPGYTATRVIVRDMCGTDWSWEVLDGALTGDNLDVCVPGEGFGLELVTRQDQDRVVADTSWYAMCQDDQDLLFTAAYLAGEISVGLAPGTSYAGVLYDPVTKYGSDSGLQIPTAFEAEEVSRDDLRLQVRDFLAWRDKRIDGGR